MGWITQNKGIIAACLASAVAGALFVLWLKKPTVRIRYEPFIIDHPTPVQPQFDSGKTASPSGPVLPPDDGDGGAIDTLTKPIPPIDSPKTSTPQAVQPESGTDTLCPPFTLRLVSGDSVPRNFGLDSVSVHYRWPPGDHYFAFWPRPQKGYPPSNAIHYHKEGLVAFGLSTSYLRYQNNLEGRAYVRLRVGGLNLSSGYHQQTRQQLSWFVSAEKLWRVF